MILGGPYLLCKLLGPQTGFGVFLQYLAQKDPDSEWGLWVP